MSLDLNRRGDMVLLIYHYQSINTKGVGRGTFIIDLSFDSLCFCGSLVHVPVSFLG